MLFSICCSLSTVLYQLFCPFAVLPICCSLSVVLSLLFSSCTDLSIWFIPCFLNFPSAVFFICRSLHHLFSLFAILSVCCFLHLLFSPSAVLSSAVLLSAVLSICNSYYLLFFPSVSLPICWLPPVQFSLVAVLLLFSSLVIIVISGSINALFSLLCLLCFVLFRLPPVVVNEINFGLSFILLLSSSISCVNCGPAAAVSCPLYSTLYNCSVFILSLFFHVLRPCSCSRCVGSLQHYCRVCNTQLNSCKQSRSDTGS